MKLRGLTLISISLFVVFLTSSWRTTAAPVGPAKRPLIFGCGRMLSTWMEKPRSFDEQLWDHMVKIGVTSNGAGLAWCDGEKKQGEYDKEALDYADFQVNGIRKRGMEPTFFVGLTPDWAKLYPNLPPHRTPPREDCIDAFMKFHSMIAKRYKGKVKYYFFWNEPNGCSWVNDGCGNGDQYALYTKWLIRCSQAIKGADPNAKIVAAQLDYHTGVTEGWRYIQGIYDNGGGPYFDGVSIHPYDSKGTIFWQGVKDTRKVLVDNGDAKKFVWISEYGWNNVNEEEQAKRLKTVLTELQKPEWSYVLGANYLVLNDGPGVEKYGLMDVDLKPRLAYYAFQEIAKGKKR